MGQRSSNNGFVEVLKCGGDLNANSMVKIKHRVDHLLKRNHRLMLLDLSNTRHIDLAGLGILVERLKMVRSVQGDIKLCRLSSHINEIFRLVGVSKLFETYETPEDAKASFHHGAAARG